MENFFQKLIFIFLIGISPIITKGQLYNGKKTWNFSVLGGTHLIPESKTLLNDRAYGFNLGRSILLNRTENWLKILNAKSLSLCFFAYDFN
ncbi:MAG: hypothetical protein ACJATA_001446 [Sphingobacteriales bacterium]|jgi:hypothetical protein